MNMFVRRYPSALTTLLRKSRSWGKTDGHPIILPHFQAQDRILKCQFFDWCLQKTWLEFRKHWSRKQLFPLPIWISQQWLHHQSSPSQILTENDLKWPIWNNLRENVSKNCFRNARKSFEVLQDRSWENANLCMSGLRVQLHVLQVWVWLPPSFPTTPYTAPQHLLIAANDPAACLSVWPILRQSLLQDSWKEVIKDIVCKSFDVILRILIITFNLDRRLPRKRPWKEFYPELCFMLSLSGE